MPYIHYFHASGVDGKRLLHLNPDDLPALKVTKIGHQEIIIQGVELLRGIVSRYYDSKVIIIMKNLFKQLI